MVEQSTMIENRSIATLFKHKLILEPFKLIGPLPFVGPAQAPGREPESGLPESEGWSDDNDVDIVFAPNQIDMDPTNPKQPTEDISETDIMTEPATDYTPDAYLANEGIDLRNNILAPGAPNPTPNNQLSTPIRHKFTYQPPSIQPISNEERLRAEALHTLANVKNRNDRRQRDAERANRDRREYEQLSAERREARRENERREAGRSTSNDRHNRRDNHQHENRMHRRYSSQNRNNNFNRPQSDRTSASNRRRNSTLKDQIKNLEHKYKKQAERNNFLETQNKILVENARATYHQTNANRLGAIQIQRLKSKK